MTTNVQEAYNQWAGSYDSMENKTRDLDKKAVRETLSPIPFQQVLELGCGTGKNTEWLLQRAAVTAVDFSEAMLAKAREKISSEKVNFQQADITQPLPFAANTYDLVMCNLVLEHVKELRPLFLEVQRVLQPGGHFFVCELHPFKQYSGSKARFEKNEELMVADSFTHDVSEFFSTSRAAGFACIELKEWFDEEEKNLPRLISFLFKK